MEAFEPYLPYLLDFVEDYVGVADATPWRDVEEFRGPNKSHCFNVAYETLTERGVKAEGEAFAGPKVFVREEAFHLFDKELLKYTKGAKQIAWRRRPTVGGDARLGTLHVTARLAVYR